MPDTLFLSTGVSLGLLAGIVSGVCYIVANGITWPKVTQPYTMLPVVRPTTTTTQQTTGGGLTTGSMVYGCVTLKMSSG
ncbi:hypothetical protein MSG28_010648 [Choristoneura fumiferana]|uniref:Uncharacterized protein n=1 Tax=Choristoneura fumiferana TaxID=7141 RepID=A0ACC0KNY9_CHOFU|nr:hypothetical protein MSG28_010648 [Choristoneura fumiferana]